MFRNLGHITRNLR